MSFFQSSKPRPAPAHRPPDERRAALGRRDQEDEDDQAEVRNSPEPDEQRPSRAMPARRERDEDDQGGNGSDEPRRSKPRLPGSRAAKMAMQHLQALTGQQPESLSGLTPSGSGWKVALDVVELERIPRSTDVMASYEIELDEEGELVGYRRLGRYYRNQVDER
jgi:hypothetical protein